jgi:RNA polymerase sigma factor (sigma-70 family)
LRFRGSKFAKPQASFDAFGACPRPPEVLFSTFGMSSSSEQYGELLRRIAADDAAARAELIERCQDRLRLRVSQMLDRFPAVRRTEATSDVLQEVLIELADALARVKPRDARHFLGLAGQHIRWRLLGLARRAGQLPTSGTLSEAGESTGDPARLAQWAEVHAYIQALPAEERELFDLIFYQGVPQPLVAEMLGVPYRTLKRRWQDARMRFVTRFQGGPF